MNTDFTLRLDQPDKPLLHREPEKGEDWSITFVDPGNETITGARVKRVEPFIKGDHFMLTYGDGVGNIPLSELLAFHLQHNRIGTVTGVRPFSRYGEMAINGDFVKEFDEKPEIQDGLVSGGYFVFQRRFLDYLQSDDPVRS